MSSILKTRDYEMFKKHESNRDLVPANVKKIMASIRANNLLQFRPILVDSEKRIIDGQHRLEAAKNLRLEIYYQVQKEAVHEDIVLLNNSQMAWKLDDYINYYISRGNENYIKLNDFIKSRGLSTVECINMISNYSGRLGSKIKNGTFKFFDKDQLEVCDYVFGQLNKAIDCLKKYLIRESKIIKSQRVRESITKLIFREGFDIDVFLSKLIIKAESVHKCSDVSEYYSMFKNIYNYRNNKPIE